ncbi:MAG: hypothetical protein IKV36_01790 [Clostridia bacterium]|nr:hypothetical protein [Clostridia bacterium]
MICKKCKNQIPDGSLYCPVCGEPQTQPDTTNINGMPSAIAGLVSLFSDKLFFVATILMTVSAAAGFVGGGIPVFYILIAIAMWMAYAAVKNKNVMGLGTPLKMFSGISLAEYILGWVVTGCFGLGGISMLLGGAALGTVTNEYLKYIGDFSDIMPNQEVGGIVIAIFGIAFIIGAVAVALLNVFVVGKMRKTAKSVLVTFQTGIDQIVNLKLTKVCMLILGIISGISALSSLPNAPLAFVSESCSAAVMIIFYVLLNNFESSKATY